MAATSRKRRKAVVAAVESMTDEGYAFRVDLRLRPEGRSGALILSLRGLSRLFRRSGRAVGAPGADQGAGLRRRSPRSAARFFELVRPFVFRPGLDAGIVADVRDMKREIDRVAAGQGRRARAT